MGAVVVGCAAMLGAGCATPADDSASIIRTTTNIAGAGVVGLERDTAQACSLPTAPDPAAGATRTVTHPFGVTEVPADPQRIVVLSTAALDAVCAVGLWERVVGAATVDGPRPQPSYLGTGISEIPGVGTVAAPDPALIAALHPDLIIGDLPAAGADFGALSGIAPTVLIGDTGDWQHQFTSLAAAMGRSAAAETALANFRTEAADAGNAVAANLTQASLVRFTGDGTRVLGNETMPAQVLAALGAHRPTAQRAGSFDVDESELTPVEGDLIYVMFAGPEGREHGETVLRSDEWKALGAATDRRVFAVDDTIWHTKGLTAARAVLTDLRNTLNAYVND
ncbi:ABC transporter substrate-binding protein [Nocardia cyriacigeorgica]|nr:ABC transporter substrate-binding protein [Nocardia cyriacigeorgica]MBF6476663.1 ABC transporter substrate-binding protein [Nocardia cyriacigeorgica]MBF6551505.1 ABC transporter substrate-binding protein [Nocardia cyriacigeorgica]